MHVCVFSSSITVTSVRHACIWFLASVKLQGLSLCWLVCICVCVLVRTWNWKAPGRPFGPIQWRNLWCREGEWLCEAYMNDRAGLERTVPWPPIQCSPHSSLLFVFRGHFPLCTLTFFFFFLGKISCQRPARLMASWVSYNLVGVAAASMLCPAGSRGLCLLRVEGGGWGLLSSHQTLGRRGWPSE